MVSHHILNFNKSKLVSSLSSVSLVCLFSLASIFNSAYAAHPLVSEDTGTQGVGGYQVEINTDWLKDEGVKTRIATATLTRGVLDNLDTFINLPYTLSEPNGFNDVSIGIKWRFFEADGFSMGLKPEYRLASGDQEKSLGDGRSGEALTLMTQYEWGAFTWLFNIGSERHRYSDPTKNQESRKYIHKSSVAMLYAINDEWTVLIDSGVRSHSTQQEKSKPQFAVLGLIHQVNDDLDLDIGYKKSLNRSETDKQIGVGITYRFK
jgi:hypothetical protein